MSHEKTAFRVFYSWQSDLPEQTNGAFIRAALRAAASALEKKHPSVQVYLDEATRDTPGSPNIPATILEKIENADAFIADLSTIRPGEGEKKLRACPNPNVIFELGYAVSQMGWSRILILLNKHFGGPEDLPFDIDRQRASAFIADPAFDKSREKGTAAELAKLCETSLEAILIGGPPRPTELVRDPATIKRRRDVAKLKYLLKFINYDALFEMTRLMPKNLEHRIFIFWEDFNATWTSPEMKIYDAALSEILNKLHREWGFLLSHGERYQLVDHSTERYVWTAQHPRATPEQERARKAIQKTCIELEGTLEKLAGLIHENYLEIDLTEERRASWDWYRTEMEDLDLPPPGSNT